MTARPRQPRSAAAPPPSAGARLGTLLALGLLVTLAHALLLAAFALLLRPPSLLQRIAPPFYTRSITPEAPPEALAAAAPAPRIAKPDRPSARIQQAPSAIKKKVTKTPSGDANADATTAAAAPETPASAPEQTADAAPAAPPPTDDAPAAARQPAIESAIEAAPEAPALPSDAPASTAGAPAGPAKAVAAAAPASAAAAAYLSQWPADTRLRYQLSGNYRGELHGDARVLWQREGARYQTSIEVDVGLLLSMHLTSQGEITEAGLQPGVYEELVRNRRRGVRLGEDVRLHNGERVPRPNAVQDAASQFVELSHRLATGQIQPVPGTQIRFWLARPGGVDEWTYDVVGEETLRLPRLGAVRTLHLKPRPLAKPRGPILAEIWYAPSLQFLPVRIRLTQGPDTYMDLLVDTIEQR